VENATPVSTILTIIISSHRGSDHLGHVTTSEETCSSDKEQPMLLVSFTSKALSLLGREMLVDAETTRLIVRTWQPSITVLRLGSDKDNTNS